MREEESNDYEQDYDYETSEVGESRAVHHIADAPSAAVQGLKNWTHGAAM